MDISVVIPTRDRCAHLVRTLEAFAAQDVGDLLAEVIVIDNGSSDDTLMRCRELISEFPYPLQVIVETTTGVSAARNRGVATASGEVILSVNDDTRPAGPSLLRHHLDAHRTAGTRTAVLGAIRFAAGAVSDNPFLSWLETGPQFDFDHLDSGDPVTVHHWYTAHMSFRRELFLAIGGMDERFPFGFEDIEFGHRMSLAGVRLLYRSDLRLIHDHQLTPSDWRRRNERMGVAGVFLNRVHPTDPPLAEPAVGLWWRYRRFEDDILRRLPTDWCWAPERLRTHVYKAIHDGSYARGYQSAAARRARAG